MNHGAKMMARNKGTFIQSKCIHFNNMQMLQLGIMGVATRRLMASMFQKENESKTIRNKLFNIGKKDESLDQGNTYTLSGPTNLHGKDFLLVDYEQSSDFILLDSP